MRQRSWVTRDELSALLERPTHRIRQPFVASLAQPEVEQIADSALALIATAKYKREPTFAARMAIELILARARVVELERLLK